MAQLIIECDKPNQIVSYIRARKLARSITIIDHEGERSLEVPQARMLPVPSRYFNGRITDNGITRT